MSIFMTKKELERIRTARNADTQLGTLWRALKMRTYKNTSENTLVQSSDTQQWWHLVWERIRDAASVYAVEPNDTLGIWLHDRVMELAELSEDAWIGPWFRQRTQPPKGALETAHIVNAVSEAYDLCPTLFTDTEKEQIIAALRERGLPMCREFLKSVRKPWINNWFCVIAGGFAAAAVILDDREAVREAVDYYRFCTTFYDADGYGESLQYGNYASLSLSHMREVLVRYDSTLDAALPIDCIANTVCLAVSSFLYMKPLGGEYGDTPYPRSFNFGDCAAIYRPTGEVLLQIASQYHERTVAGLARWLFDTTYTNPADGPDELATFGFYNQFSYVSLLYLPDAAPALSPEDADMNTVNVYKTGNAVIRDSWTQTKTVLGAQIGYETHPITAHRHADQNSFVLAYDGERYFADPGHCCYRLQTWRDCCKTEHHNTWDFEDAEGNRYTQALCQPGQPPLNTLVSYPQTPGFSILASDCAAAYGAHFKRCERVWITAFPDLMFMIDRVETDIPMKMTSHFVLNNRDNKLRSKIADDRRLVFRRGQGAIKFFTFADEPLVLQQRWGFIHDYYHPLANQRGQGKEGSAEIYDYVTDFGTSHLIIHPFVMNETTEILYWHIKNPAPGVYRIYNRDDAHSWTLTIRPDEELWFTLSEEHHK